jgi:hypothetical protein
LGGGVAVYISNDCQFNRLSSLQCNLFEVLWLLVGPKQLPRPLSSLVVAVVYCPPCYNADQKKTLSKHIMDSCDYLLHKYPGTGIFIVGNFNSLHTDYFAKHMNLRQIVTNKKTRKKNILDMICTNCGAYYKIPFVTAPVGKSDHSCVLLSPGPCVRPTTLVRWVHRQCLDDGILNELDLEISHIRWQDMYNMQECNHMVSDSDS